MTKTLKKKIKSFSWKKIQWEKVLSAALAVLLLVGAIAGIATLAGKKTKTISSFAFDRGTINAKGEFEKSDTSIYTEDMFECQGLTIEPDFKATGTYQVFYYTADKIFTGATEVMNASDPTYEKGDSFAYAKYARIVINPSASAYADDGEEFKIRFYEVTGYANDYTITVSKKQKAFEKVSVSIDSSTIGRYFSDDQPVGQPLNFDLTNEEWAVSSDIDVKDASFFGFCSNYDATVWRCAFLDANGDLISIDYLWVDNYGCGSLEVPEDAYILKIILDVNKTCFGWIVP